MCTMYVLSPVGAMRALLPQVSDILLDESAPPRSAESDALMRGVDGLGPLPGGLPGTFKATEEECDAGGGG